MAEPLLPPGVFLRRNFLAPLDFAQVLAALDRLGPSWKSSEELGLLGRNHTSQVRSSDLAVQAPMDELRRIVAPAALGWARTCGFVFRAPPQLQMFPVLMRGDERAPPHQAPHVDSAAGQPAPPICANVFYARAAGVRGGQIALARDRRGDSTDPIWADPILLAPAPNTLVSFIGDWVHWVEPLLAGERLSLVVNFY